MIKGLFPTWLLMQFTTARWLEFGAGLFTLYGMFYGSTTPLGIVMYLVGTAFWFALTIFTKQWGLMPLNIGALFVLIHNVLKLV